MHRKKETKLLQFVTVMGDFVSFIIEKTAVIKS